MLFGIIRVGIFRVGIFLVFAGSPARTIRYTPEGVRADGRAKSKWAPLWCSCTADGGYPCASRRSATRAPLQGGTAPVRPRSITQGWGSVRPVKPRSITQGWGSVRLRLALAPVVVEFFEVAHSNYCTLAGRSIEGPFDRGLMAATSILVGSPRVQCTPPPCAPPARVVSLTQS